MAAPVVEPLNPLSVPRGVRYADELTGDSAKYVCTIGTATYYYATLESQALDYEGVLHKIAPLMTELSTLSSSVGTSVERAGHVKRIRALESDIIKICDAQATSNLSAKKFELVIPAALRGLRALISLHGDSSIELISAYLVLAEANLGMGRIAQAEAFLSNANFILVKHPDASNVLRSRMHRNFGRVHAAQGNNAAALESFSRDIFFCTLAMGPEHVTTSIGYFFLAQVFAAQIQMEAALAFFDKVVDIWYKHLLGAKSGIATALELDFGAHPPAELLAKSFIASGDAHPSTDAFYAAARAESGASPVSRLSDTQVSEGLEMLEFICRVRETHLGKTHIATGEVMYTQALLMLHAGKDVSSIPLLEGAHAIFLENLVCFQPPACPRAAHAALASSFDCSLQGADHPSCADLRELLARARTGGMLASSRDVVLA